MLLDEKEGAKSPHSQPANPSLAEKPFASRDNF